MKIVNPVLKSILSKAVKAYDDNGVLQDYIDDPDGEHGDTLAEFVVREASDVFDPEADETINAREIARAMNTAIKQLAAVREAIFPCLGE